MSGGTALSDASFFWISWRSTMDTGLSHWFRFGHGVRSERMLSIICAPNRYVTPTNDPATMTSTRFIRPYAYRLVNQARHQEDTLLSGRMRRSPCAV